MLFYQSFPIAMEVPFSSLLMLVAWKYSTKWITGGKFPVCVTLLNEYVRTSYVLETMFLMALFALSFCHPMCVSLSQC